MLPRKAPLAKAHNSVKEHATKILGTILGEVQQGWVFLCTEEAQDILGTYTSPLAAVPKHSCPDCDYRRRPGCAIPAEVAAPSKRGPSAFILAYLIETELNLPSREDLTCFL